MDKPFLFREGCIQYSNTQPCSWLPDFACWLHESLSSCLINSLDRYAAYNVYADHRLPYFIPSLSLVSSALRSLPHSVRPGSEVLRACIFAREAQCDNLLRDLTIQKRRHYHSEIKLTKHH